MRINRASYFCRKSISRNTTHPQSYNLQALLMSERQKQEQKKQTNWRLKSIN